MSWSIAMIGTAAGIEKALNERSAKETGQCKVEFDAALPHLLGLVKENFNNQEGGQAPLIEVEASGSGYCKDGNQVQRSCTAKVTAKYGTFVGLALVAVVLAIFTSAASAADTKELPARVETSTLHPPAPQFDADVAGVKNFSVATAALPGRPIERSANAIRAVGRARPLRFLFCRARR